MSYHCCEKFHIAIPAGHILKLRKFEHYVKKNITKSKLPAEERIIKLQQSFNIPFFILI